MSKRYNEAEKKFFKSVVLNDDANFEDIDSEDFYAGWQSCKEAVLELIDEKERYFSSKGYFNNTKDLIRKIKKL